MKHSTKFSTFAFCAFIVIISFGFYLSIGSDRNLTLTMNESNVSGDVQVVSGPVTDNMVGAWTTGAVFPAPTTDLGHGQGYTRNDTGWVYIIGGEVGLPNVRRYNTRTNVWSSVAPLPEGRDRGTSARLGDSLYMIGGANPTNTYTNTLTRYDIRTDTWVPRAPLPNILGWGRGAGYQDSLIYVAGGYNGTATVNTVYLYNAKTNTWRTASPLPAVRFGGGFAVSGDTLIYVGGVDGAAVVNTVYRGVISQSDRSVITWTTGTPMPTGMFRIDAHTWGNRGIIVTGGSSATGFTSVSNLCWVYSPGANTWTTQANKPTAWTAGNSGAVQLSGGIWKLVCASGYGGTAQLTQTEIFTDTLATPSAGGSITICRDGLNKSIPDNQPNNPLLDTISISGIPAGMEIKRITVTIDSVLHTWVGDLRMWITKGAVVDTLIGRIGLGTGAFPGAGNSCDNLIGAKLVDTAVALIQNLPDPAPGCGDNTANQTQSNGYFKPKFPLTGFTNDVDPNGLYVLRITDNAAADLGTLRSWCVTVEYDVMTSNGNITNIVDDYSLAQNYPNPFNPTTTIQYSIPKSGFVSLKVYDMAGKEVANLVSEQKQAGQHQVYFTAANLASGAYFYRIQVNDFIQVRKMILVK
jgi:subtilisin-like proprotein convertase family protein